MSGHSKWSTIKRKKGAQDAKRGQLFTRIAGAITVAARTGGGDPDANSSLALAIAKAKQANMPKDNIDRAIERGTGDGDGIALEMVRYEAYGPGGMALIIEGITDNTNRTVSEVKHALTKHGARFADPGSVLWMFTQKGVLLIDNPALSDGATLTLIDAGAADIVPETEGTVIYTDPDALAAVQHAATAHGLQVEDASLSFVATTPVTLSEKDVAAAERVVQALTDLDDVQTVTTNIE